MSEELILCVDDVANALQLSRESVLRLLRKKVLNGIKEGGTWFVFQNSLRSYVLSLIATRYAPADCKNVGEDELKNEKSTRQNTTLARFNNREEVPKGMLPAEAAVRLQSAFSYRVFRMGIRDYHLRQDLIQEMSLCTLKCTGHNSRTYYLLRARSRACDYLRMERMRGMQSFDAFSEEEQEKLEPAVPAKPDCTPIIQLFKLAGIPLSRLYEFGIYLFDEEEQEFRASLGESTVNETRAHHDLLSLERKEGATCPTDSLKESA